MKKFLNKITSEENLFNDKQNAISQIVIGVIAVLISLFFINSERHILYLPMVLGLLLIVEGMSNYKKINKG